MTAKQIEAVSLLIDDLGMTVIEIDDRYFVGQIEIPDETQKHCTVMGKEITHLVNEQGLRKTGEQFKMDVTEFTNKTAPMTIKFNVNSKWYCYSR